MKIAFITGLSDYGNNSLSCEQTLFLNNLHTQKSTKIYYNFPYIESFKAYRKTNLLVASFSNMLHYFLARTTWLDKKTKPLKEIIDKEEKVLLLSGSCGLEILNNMKFSKEEKMKIHIIAYGPVARQIPDFSYLTLVQGTKDWISRMWISVYDIQIESNHMNYLESKEFLNFVNSYIEKMENTK